MEREQIAIDSEFIKLDSFLKFAGLAQTGGQALDDQKDHDQADPDGRHGEWDPGDDHRQNLLLRMRGNCLP